MKSTTWMILLVAMAFPALADGPTTTPAPPKAPPVSKFAPAQDLAHQVDYYVKRLEKSVATEEDYKDLVERIAKDSNTFIVIALTLGMHDKDNPYKKAAPAMIEAASKLAAAKNYAEAKAGVAAVKKATKAKSAGTSKLRWEKSASLKQLMLAVPTINADLKRKIKLRRPKRDAPMAAEYSATLAAIAQASMYNSGDTKKPELAEKWYKFCEEMRDAAAEVNGIAHRVDKKAVRPAVEKLAKSCDHCHEVFDKEALEKAKAQQ
jgi:hypothetical protein